MEFEAGEFEDEEEFYEDDGGERIADVATRGYRLGAGDEEPERDPVAEAYEQGAEDVVAEQREQNELVRAADALEERFPELADPHVQDEIFGLIERAGVDPSSPRALEIVEEIAGEHFLDRADDGDRIIDLATRTRYRLGA
jgi:hypothetical protein